MPTKPQHALHYQPVPPLLRTLREEAGLTQRVLAEAISKPQTWVHNCETGTRRVDIAEFVAWARACGVKPEKALRRFLNE